MRWFRIPLVVALLLCGACEKNNEVIPEKMPAAKIAPEVEPKQVSPPPADEPAASKGVGAAGCESTECAAACTGFEQPECAEAFAAGCFGATPPADKGCDKYIGESDAFERKPKTRARPSKKALKEESDDEKGAKATPIGD